MSDSQAGGLQEWLNTWPESEEFAQRLENAICEVEKPETRAKLMMELLTFTRPKMKAMDPDELQQPTEVNITFEQVGGDEG